MGFPPPGLFFFVQDARCGTSSTAWERSGRFSSGGAAVRSPSPAGPATTYVQDAPSWSRWAAWWPCTALMCPAPLVAPSSSSPCDTGGGSAQRARTQVLLLAPSRALRICPRRQLLPQPPGFPCASWCLEMVLFWKG